MSDSTCHLNDLLRRAEAGDTEALAHIFGQFEHRLRQMIRLRMDHRLQARVDTEDVLQEAFLDVVDQLHLYAEKRDDMSFFLWLRLVTAQRLLRTHRLHLGAEMRAAGREVSLHRGAIPLADSVSLANQLLGRFTSASQAAIRAEMKIKLQEALNGMDHVDREVIALRHFEELTNQETAKTLGLSKTAASNRYIRALARLHDVLKTIPGFLDQIIASRTNREA